jgi:uncharacterized repeat protein (TIGR03833 family)
MIHARRLADPWSCLYHPQKSKTMSLYNLSFVTFWFSFVFFVDPRIGFRENEYNGFMPFPKRSEIRPGLRVQIVEKPNQRSGELTAGVVARILTKSPAHPHGIKVMLEDGKVGRVQSIESPAPNPAAAVAGRPSGG